MFPIRPKTVRALLDRLVTSRAVADRPTGKREKQARPALEARGLALGNHLAVALLCAAVLILPLAIAPDSTSAPGEEPVPPGLSTDRIHVKFREGSSVRLRGGGFASLTNANLAGLAALLGRYPSSPQRLFTQPEDDLASDQRQAERRSGRQLADLNLWFRLRIEDAARTQALLDALKALPFVETAYREPVAPPPPASPDFTPSQGYRNAAPTGIDAGATATVPGAQGDGIKVVDIEYAWNQQHEDLSKARAPGALIPNGTPRDPFNDDNHGTAVLGEISGDDNGFGVTGLVPDAAIGLVNAYNLERGYELGNAINIARQNMSAGDVMLLEQQTAGVNGGCGSDQVGCAPVEWVPAYYDAIETATAAGIIVVEAAGNGNQNLGAASYGSPFPAGRADSGAIIVGAGGAPEGNCFFLPPPARSRLGFSNYGSRVDVQGWGQCVTTTGYGAYQGGADRNLWYTSGFGGTSSASPIVAAAAASLSGARKAADPAQPLTPTEARSILAATGTPQELAASGSLAGHIGPLPNLAAALARLSGGPGSTPDNDAFLRARPLLTASGTAGGSSTGASKETGEPSHAGSTGGGSVWYEWTAPANGTVTFDTGGSGFDTLLGVYTGTSVGALTLVAQNDNDPAGGTTSKVASVPVTDAVTYRIAVDGSGATSGAVALNWSFTSGPTPANNAFGAAGLVSGSSGSVVGSNVGGTKETGEPFHGGNIGAASVWYRWTAPSTGTATLDTATSSFNTLLGIYTGTAVNALSTRATNDDDPAGGTTSKVSFAVTSGTTYRIAVDGFGGATGSLRLAWSLAPAPANDAFASAQLLSGNSGGVTGSNANATKEAGEPNHAGNVGGRSIWYRWSAPAAGTLTLDACTSGFNTVLAVYTGSTVNGLTGVASNDDHADCSPQSKLTLTVTGGTLYRIAVDGVGAASGSLQLGWSFAQSTSPPTNDNFANAQTLTVNSGSITGSNANATKEAGEPDPAGNPGGASVWYRWTAPGDGTVTMNTSGSGFNTLLAVYTGSSLNALTLVAQNDDDPQFAGQTTSRIFPFLVTGGTVYWIAVDGYKAGTAPPATGPVTLSWTFSPPPANDHLAAGQALTGDTGSLGATIVGATKETGEPNHAGNSGGHSLWYRWSAASAGTLTIHTGGSPVNTLLAAYTGTAVNALSLVTENDDDGTSTSSRVTFTVAPGTTYHLAVDGKSGAWDQFSLNWSLVIPVCLNANATIVGTPSGETLTGTSGNDVIDGGGGNDTIDGGGGSDRICGGEGQDRIAGGEGGDIVSPGPGDDNLAAGIDGGAGSDVISYATAPAGVTVELSAGTASGGDGNDTFTGFENVEGSAFGDTLTGDEGRNNLFGLAGDDTLNGGLLGDGLDPGPGTDVVNGGGGFDNASYFFRTATVTLSLDGIANDGEAGEGDNIGPLGDVEALQGGFGADTLTGNSAGNNLFGQGGNDTLNGEGGNDGLDPGLGADTLNGGAGTDTASYFYRAAGVSLSIDLTSNDGEPGEGDNIQDDVENLQGGRGNDTLSGHDDDAFVRDPTLTLINRLSGQGGDDTITSRDSPTHADTVLCGPGTDTVSADGSDLFPDEPPAPAAPRCETITLP